MLIAMKAMRNTTLKGLDGELGTLDDLFFDDESWVVRYLVVDTGGWLTGREVILSPEVVEQADWSHNALAVKLTKQQVRDSPGVSADQPVSRQHEQDLAQYYGWQPYWTPLTGVSPHGPHTATAKTALPEPHVEQKTHLRSAVEAQNYRLHANDGDMGHVEDYIVDEAVDRALIPAASVAWALNWYAPSANGVPL